MKVYKISPYTGEKHAYIENTGHSWDVIDAIIDGERIEEHSVDLRKMVLKNKTKLYPDLLGTGSTEYFVSEPLRLFIEQNVKHQPINFIEVTIADKKYWLLNIIGLRNCMDYEQSTYTVYEKVNKPDQITKLVVREDKLYELDLFRLLDRPEIVFVTEPLKKALDKEGFTGIRYFDNMDLTKI
ncbi:MAG: imm11 family protein [Thermonemataceae bacterium]